MTTRGQRRELADRWFTMGFVASAFNKIQDSEFETVTPGRQGTLSVLETGAVSRFSQYRIVNVSLVCTGLSQVSEPGEWDAGRW